MVKNSFLDSLGYQYHSVFKTMHCTECKFAVTFKQLTTHPSIHNIKIPDIPKIQKQLTDYPLHDIDDLNRLLPLSGGPPVQYLNTIPGFKCTECEHTAPNHRTISNQFLKDHPHLGKISVDQRFIPVQIQRFFNINTSLSFAVNPELQQLSSDSPYAIYLRNPISIKSPTLVFPIKATKDLHPLTVMTGWHNHVEPYMDNKSTILQLVTLCGLPTSKEVDLKGLNSHVIAYLITCGTLAKKAGNIVKQMLKRFPM